MIALLAAVPEETRLIRQTCDDLVCSQHHGLEIWTGHYAGAAIALVHSGIGKAAAATAATTLLLTYHPKAFWLFGCGGAYPSSHLGLGDLALADLEIFGDEGVETGDGFKTLVEMDLAMRQTKDGPMFNAWPVDNALAEWAQPLLEKHCAEQNSKFSKGPFITVSSCTGTADQAIARSARTGVVCENMEGAAVALACHQFGTPLLELRGISNLVEERDTRRWDLAAGMVTAQKAILTLLTAHAER